MFKTDFLKGMYFEADTGMEGGDVNLDTGNDASVDDTYEEEVQEEAQETQAYSLNGQEYTQEQLMEALQAKENEAKWRAELSSKGQEVNLMMKMLEQQRANSQPVTPPQQPQQQEITAERLRDLLLDGSPEAMSHFDNLVESKIASTVGQLEVRQRFLEKHSDFDEVTNTPEFQQFEMSNPDYNRVNAYLEYKMMRMQSDMDRVRDEAFKKGEAETLKNLKAKGAINVLKGSGAAPAPGQKPIADMSRSEITRAITDRILAQRQES